MSKTKRMLGLIGTVRKPNMRDTDRDGVIDVLDCSPRNPRKQGFQHWIKAKQQGRSYQAVVGEARETKREARTAAWQERRKQVVQTAVHKEKARGERARSSYKSRPKSHGNLIHGFTRTISEIGRAGRGSSSFGKAKSKKKKKRQADYYSLFD